MKRLIYSLLVYSFLFTACDSWLDVVLENDITTIDTDFETRDEANNWLESCYSFIMNKYSIRESPGLLGADEMIWCDYLTSGYNWTFKNTFIPIGMQNSLDPYCDTWLQVVVNGSEKGRTDYYTAISMCNTFIAKIDQVYNMEEYEKIEWKAEVKALKAYYYLEMVRQYGPIILVPENIDPNAAIEVMKEPRCHVDTCFNAIVNLCDEVAEILPHFNQKKTNRRTYFNKEAVLALKARALLYQASDLFNGNPDYASFTNKRGEPLFSTVKDREKWRRAAEAAEEAIKVCLDGGRKLVDDQSASTELQTHMLNIEASTQVYNYTNDEVLWMIKTDAIWNYTLPSLNTDPYQKLMGTTIAPTMKMVEMFYTINGLPISQDPTYGGGNIYNLTKETDPKYTDVVVLNEDIPVLHTRREPRFYANIAADRCYWRLGRNVDNLYKVEAYQGENFGLKAQRLTSTVPENLTGYWIKKWSCSRATLFDYASTESALGVNPFPAIRMAELYLIAAEAWNEYLDAPNAQVYDNLDEVRKRAGIPSVRESWAMARDKNKVNTQNGMRDIIRQEWNVEFAFEGVRFWNLRRWKTAYIELNEKIYGWNVTGNNKNSFYNNGKGPVVVDSKRKFLAPRDYFWPIRSEETMISGCVQNPGW